MPWLPLVSLPQGTGWELVEKQPSVPWLFGKRPLLGTSHGSLAIARSIWVEVGLKKTNREIDQLDNATNMEVQALDILNDS